MPVKDWRGLDERSDLIDLFMHYTENIPSIEPFRLWSAIALVAGALERRVWTVSRGKALFPNMYIMLVAVPGVGKTIAIEHTNELWSAVKPFYVAPHDITKAALVDALAKASRRVVLGETHLVEYHSLLVAADEFGVLVPSHDNDFLSTLTKLYDNPPVHQQNRRGLKEQISIIAPQLNILAGVQPAYLASLLPEEAWGMGFMARVIMIYGGAPEIRGLGLDDGDPTYEGMDRELYNVILARVKALADRYGQLRWEPAAKAAAEEWVLGGGIPVPTYSKLQHYNQRRTLHMMKLAVVSAESRQNKSITLADFHRALGWLIAAETHMPDVFREMSGKSDKQVIDELFYHVWQLWIKHKKPIHESTLIHFLSTRVTADKINRILEVALRSNVLDRIAGTDTWRPRPKHEHGME